MSTTGDRIKAARKAKGLTQKELADKVGVKYSAIHKYEAGLIVNLKRDIIAKLADALEVKPSYLLGLEDTLAYEVKESQSGRTKAKEDMYRTFGVEHSAADLRMVGERTALLYYKALDRRCAPELLGLINEVDEMEYVGLENIRLLVQAYLHADAQIREIVDTALKPYRQEEIASEEIG